MKNTLGATVRQEREEEAGASELTHQVSGKRLSPYRLWLAPDVASHLGRYISPIVAKLRKSFDDRHHKRGTDEADKLTIDLSDASSVPCAQLIFLINLLRHALGNNVVITLSGVKPMILGSLVAFDLPNDVVVIDSRGRRWAS